MKIKQYWCSAERKPVPLDHYTSGTCFDPPMPLPWLMAVHGQAEGDTRHAGNKLSATRTMGCMREYAILDNIPVTLNPSSLNSSTWGTAIHAFCEQYGNPADYNELSFPLEGQPAPVLFGVPITGKVDLLGRDTIVLTDWKCHSEAAQKMKWKDHKAGNASPELRVQFSIYRELAMQCIPGANPQKAIVWHGAMCGGKCPARPWFQAEVRFMSEAEMLDMRPFGGTNTIREKIALYTRFVSRVNMIKVMDANEEAKHELVEEAIKELPLEGRAVWGGAKCTSYCPALWDCDRLSGTIRI